jgi:hypothetical protein
MAERVAFPPRFIICQSCGRMIRARMEAQHVVLTYDLSAPRSFCLRSHEDTCPLLMRQIARLLRAGRRDATEQRSDLSPLN